MAPTADNRFRDNENGTVTDLATALIWKRCVEGVSGTDCTTGHFETFTWQEALQHAEATAFAGSTQWRLPDKNELASLVEASCAGPAINEVLFPNTAWSATWSSSPYARDSSRAWTVEFNNGWVGYDDKGFPWFVRLVRDPL
ncbi:Lcl C-terminal domain-containing protein [Thiohalocapsa halophila]